MTQGNKSTKSTHKKTTGKRTSPKKGKAQKKAQSSGDKAILVVIIILALVAVGGLVLLKSQKMTNEETVVVHIPTGSNIEDVTDTLIANGCLKETKAFHLLSRIRMYSKHVKPGAYQLTPSMNMWNALTKLYYGNQDAIRLTINKHRTKQSFCDFVGSKLELSANDLLVILSDDYTCQSYGFNEENILCMFIQNTYDFYWNTSTEKFMIRMKKEYEKFWNAERTKKCKSMNLTPEEVIILASIVEEETNKNDEKADVASVYLNRIRKGMLLQADPTLKFALQDFTLRRLLNQHMEVESPYNTYKHRGLPPGPICIPSIASIDAVLQNKRTEYLYFCAKADFSGYHAFAKSLAEHNANAQAFHAELNRRKIYK